MALLRLCVKIFINSLSVDAVGRVSARRGSENTLLSFVELGTTLGVLPVRSSTASCN